MLRIGYARREEETQALQALGCDVVRIEAEAPDRPVLASVLEFMGADDELVAPNLMHLGRAAADMLDLIERLEGRGAALVLLDPPASSRGDEGRLLRSVLQALAALESAESAKRRSRAPAHEIRALRREGLGPAEIARRLGVSRMTVYRKLRCV